MILDTKILTEYYTEPKWADTTVLSGDIAAAISELKAKPGGELQVSSLHNGFAHDAGNEGTFVIALMR